MITVRWSMFTTIIEFLVIVVVCVCVCGRLGRCQSPHSTSEVQAVCLGKVLLSYSHRMVDHLLYDDKLYQEQGILDDTRMSQRCSLDFFSQTVVTMLQIAPFCLVDPVR